MSQEGVASSRPEEEYLEESALDPDVIEELDSSVELDVTTGLENLDDNESKPSRIRRCKKLFLVVIKALRLHLKQMWSLIKFLIIGKNQVLTITFYMMLIAELLGPILSYTVDSFLIIMVILGIMGHCGMAVIFSVLIKDFVKDQYQTTSFTMMKLARDLEDQLTPNSSMYFIYLGGEGQTESTNSVQDDSVVPEESEQFEQPRIVLAQKVLDSLQAWDFKIKLLRIALKLFFLTAILLGYLCNLLYRQLDIISFPIITLLINTWCFVFSYLRGLKIRAKDMLQLHGGGTTST